jgi:hypothetical protein
MSEVLEAVRMVGGDWVRFRNVRYSSQWPGPVVSSGWSRTVWKCN